MSFDRRTTTILRNKKENTQLLFQKLKRINEQLNKQQKQEEETSSMNSYNRININKPFSQDTKRKVQKIIPNNYEPINYDYIRQRRLNVNNFQNYCLNKSRAQISSKEPVKPTKSFTNLSPIKLIYDNKSTKSLIQNNNQLHSTQRLRNSTADPQKPRKSKRYNNSKIAQIERITNVKLHFQQQNDQIHNKSMYSQFQAINFSPDIQRARRLKTENGSIHSQIEKIINLTLDFKNQQNRSNSHNNTMHQYLQPINSTPDLIKKTRFSRHNSSIYLQNQKQSNINLIQNYTPKSNHSSNFEKKSVFFR